MAKSTNKKTKPKAEEKTAVEEVAPDTIRIRVNVAVNGHVAGDKLVVERDHPFYSAILAQNLAEIIGEDA